MFDETLELRLTNAVGATLRSELNRKLPHLLGLSDEQAKLLEQLEFTEQAKEIATSCFRVVNIWPNTRRVMVHLDEDGLTFKGSNIVGKFSAPDKEANILDLVNLRDSWVEMIATQSEIHTDAGDGVRKTPVEGKVSGQSELLFDDEAPEATPDGIMEIPDNPDPDIGEQDGPELVAAGPETDSAPFDDEPGAAVEHSGDEPNATKDGLFEEPQVQNEAGEWVPVSSLQAPVNETPPPEKGQTGFPIPAVPPAGEYELTASQQSASTVLRDGGTIQEAAFAASVSERTIQRWCRLELFKKAATPAEQPA